MTRESDIIRSERCMHPYIWQPVLGISNNSQVSRTFGCRLCFENNQGQKLIVMSCILLKLIIIQNSSVSESNCQLLRYCWLETRNPRDQWDKKVQNNICHFFFFFFFWGGRSIHLRIQIRVTWDGSVTRDVCIWIWDYFPWLRLIPEAYICFVPEKVSWMKP